jgi:hypothetical protein
MRVQKLSLPSMTLGICATSGNGTFRKCLMVRVESREYPRGIRIRHLLICSIIGFRRVTNNYVPASEPVGPKGFGPSVYGRTASPCSDTARLGRSALCARCGRPRQALRPKARRSANAGVLVLPSFIRCHSRFRISRMEVVYSLPPHGYKCIRSEFVH